jgi:hypothetical protein
MNTAMVITNTGVTESTEDFLEAQNTMKDPMVLIMNKSECVDHYRIVAKDIEELESMNEEKVFFTSSIPKGEVKKEYGAIFYGVDPTEKQKKTASCN